MEQHLEETIRRLVEKENELRVQQEDNLKELEKAIRDLIHERDRLWKENVRNAIATCLGFTPGSS